MQIAFSTHACNDWSLEWQGVKNKKQKTVLCFTAGAAEPASWSCMSNIFTSKASNLGRYQSLIVWLWRGNATAQQRSGSYFLQEVDKIGHNKRNPAEKPKCFFCFFSMQMTSPGFWSAVVLCLCCWAAGACHWGWGLSAWAARKQTLSKWWQLQGKSK